MGKCENKQRKSCITKTNYKHFERGYGRLPLGDLYTCHAFFFKTHKFEKANSKTFFHKFTQQFVNREFSNPWELAFNKILETRKQLYVTLGKWARLPQGLKNKVLKQPMNHHMIMPAPKLQDVYDSKTNHGSTTKGEKIITLFIINCGTIKC